MQRIKIGIVEDESIVALGIIQVLTELGYDVTKVAANYTQAIEIAEREKPDLILIDILLGGHKDGIDLAWTIKKEFNIPFIFLTANSDAATVDRAKKTEAQAYLIKPFRKNELFAAIELCLYNYDRRQKESKEERNNYIVNNSLFIKQGRYFHKISIDEILYLESEGIYLSVHTLNSKLLVRSNLQEYLDIISSKNFCRVHRSYAVNIGHIQRFNSECVVVNDVEIPLARAYKEELHSLLKLG